MFNAILRLTCSVNYKISEISFKLFEKLNANLMLIQGGGHGGMTLLRNFSVFFIHLLQVGFNSFFT